MNYYKVLGIDENATKEEIKKAYDKQVQTFREEVKDEKLEDGVVYEHTQADPIKDEETKDGVKFIEGGF